MEEKILFLMWLFTPFATTLVAASPPISFGRVYVNELFSTKIEPKMFNWTLDIMEQFKYRASLHGHPDLPTWMRYMYSREHHAGYLYGTPPEQLSGQELRIDIVGLNRKTYDTKVVSLSLFVTRKSKFGANSIHMKIDNLNWVHLMDPGRVENLKNIFKQDLWPESRSDLHLSFMESAVAMGGRLPLPPNQPEGVIVHLASRAPFSDRLIELQEEVRPLYKISSCNYKRTSVQTIFENAGFKLDWCAFRIVSDTEEIMHKMHGSEHSVLRRKERWEPMARGDAPRRNYIDELAFAIAIPGMVLAIAVAVLTAVLCLQHDKIYDQRSEYFFDNIFHLCTDLREPAQYPTNQHQTVQMVQYSDINQPTTTLKSLKDPNVALDNISDASQSPSMYRVDASLLSGNTTLRPRPPPYKLSTLNRNGVQI